MTTSWPQLSRRVFKVWLRNRDVFLKTYKTAFLTQVLEPILYIFALGLGLGGFVALLEGETYLTYIAPSLVATSIMYAGYSECSYGSFVRMYYQKTFDAIIATPITLDEVIAGEMLWGATKSLINASIVLGVIAILGLTSEPIALLIPVIAFIGGGLFSALAMCFTARSTTIESLSYPTALLITPMFLFSGTFFPISVLPSTLQFLIQLTLPLYHIVTVIRALVLNQITALLWMNIAWIGSITIILFFLAIILMKKRLIA